MIMASARNHKEKCYAKTIFTSNHPRYGDANTLIFISGEVLKRLLRHGCGEIVVDCFRFFGADERLIYPWPHKIAIKSMSSRPVAMFIMVGTARSLIDSF